MPAPPPAADPWPGQGPEPGCGGGRGQEGGVLLGAKQQHRADGAPEGDVASGGRSWETKPQKAAEEVEVDEAKGRIEIFGKEDAWETHRFPDLNIDLPDLGRGSTLTP